MDPVGKVTCKVFSKRMFHTYKGMISYCLKDTSSIHFECTMYNISDATVTAEKKTLHSIYGKVDLQGRVILSSKNLVEKMFVWNKYNANRPFTASFLSTYIYDKVWNYHAFRCMDHPFQWTPN